MTETILAHDAMGLETNKVTSGMDLMSIRSEGAVGSSITKKLSVVGKETAIVLDGVGLGSRSIGAKIIVLPPLAVSDYNILLEDNKSNWLQLSAYVAIGIRFDVNELKI